MTDEKEPIGAKATIPTEEDIRAARFWLQVQEEAQGYGVSPGAHLTRNYPSPSHGSYYKRGAAIMIRFDIVLSPDFLTSDKETAEALEAMYKKVVYGPLIRFKLDYGKKGRYCGLVLRERPNMGIDPGPPEHTPKAAAPPTPEGFPDMEPWAYQEAVNIIRKAQGAGAIPSEARSFADRFARRVVDSGLAVDPHLASTMTDPIFDLTVDYQGVGIKTNQALMNRAGYGMIGGVAQNRAHYFYLSEGGQGQVVYINATGIARAAKIAP